MSATGSFLFLLLSFLLRINPSLSYSLKNCTVLYSDRVADVNVTCNDRDLSAVPHDVPTNAISLDLSFNCISTINRTDLRSLSKLRYLQMRGNSLSQIDNGAFADLVDLRNLDLSVNKLTNLTDKMFDGLSKLLDLSLSTNPIAHISPRAFEPLISLQTIDLTFNAVREMSDIQSVLQPPNLESLDLQFNSFTSFQSDGLRVSNLRTLRLSSKLLLKFTMKTNVFPRLELFQLSVGSSDFQWDVADESFLRNVTTLDLSGSETSLEIYRQMLQSADSLQNLILTSIMTWTDNVVDVACQLPALRTLDLSFNKFQRLNDSLLQSCSRLTQLDLSVNDLTELPEFSLVSLKQLRSLTLDYNLLSEVPVALRGLSALEILDLRSNEIIELRCSDVLNLTRLTELNLSNNRISVLRGCIFHSLNDLKVLNLRQNIIFTLGDTFKVGLQKLKVLKLQGNHLKHLHKGEFRSLTSLQSLELQSLQFHIVYSETFQGLEDLRHLGLSLLSYKREMFTGLQHLESLTLYLSNVVSGVQLNAEPPFSDLSFLKNLEIKNYNQMAGEISADLLKGLRSLEFFSADKFFVKQLHVDTFRYTPRLKSLQITDSDLSDLTPELFQPIPNLQALDLSNNKLRSLDFLVQANLSALRWLKLRHNELTVINQSLVHSLPALTYLDLLANPLTCDCTNSDFIQWVQSNNQTQVVNAHQYSCTFPVSTQSRSFLDFDVQSCWVDAGFLFYVSSSCLIAFTLLASFIYHFLRWQLVYAYYLFLAFLYDSRERKKGSPHRYDAFVSYNVHDEAWVYTQMLPVLEGEQGWRLCLHHRDFQPGEKIGFMLYAQSIARTRAGVETSMD